MTSTIQGQVCERQFGNSFCWYHPEMQVVFLCIECKKLVCLDCITSSDHSGHSFNKLENLIKERVNTIGKFIENSNRIFQLDISKSIAEIEAQKCLNNEDEASLSKDIKMWCAKFTKDNTQTKDMETEIKLYFSNHNKNLCTSKNILIAKKKQLEELTKELTDIIDHGTPVKKYDASETILQKETEAKTLPVIPKTDNIELLYVEYEAKNLITKALDEIKGISVKPPKSQRTISTSSLFNIRSQCYYAVTPVTKDNSWCCVCGYYGDNTKYYPTNKLCMINKQGLVEQELQTSVNIRSLCLHPITKVLHGTFADKTIRTIDTITGTTTTVLTFTHVPDRLTFTSDGDIIVGEYALSFGHLYRYTSNGQLVRQSKEKFKVYDVSFSNISNNVAIACKEKGVIIIDETLTNVARIHSLVCITAVYANDDSLVIGDWKNKSIHIIDGKTFSTIKTFIPPQMSYPALIRVCDNSMWILCRDPNNIVHVRFQ